MLWRVAALALACVAGACTRTAESESESRTSSLRVPLPDGWRASAVAGGLHVGPSGHVALHLESTSRPMPALEDLLRALEAEKVKVLHKESLDTFLGVRYQLEAGVQGFLGVRRAGARTVWCSTTREATDEEVEASMTVCRSLSWDQ